MPVESPLVWELKKCLMQGDWSSSISALDKMLSEKIIDRIQFNCVKVEIYKEIFMEMINDNRYFEASFYLKSMLKIADQSMQSSLMQLSVYLFSPKEHFIETSEWSGDISQCRQKMLVKIQDHLGPSVMLPPGRLVELVKQSLIYQSQNCRYHFDDSENSIENISILTDHYCSK